MATNSENGQGKNAENGFNDNNTDVYDNPIPRDVLCYEKGSVLQLARHTLRVRRNMRRKKERERSRGTARSICT